MSLRKSLYKHYNRNSSSTTSFLNYVDQTGGDKHWVRGWYDPPKISKDTNLLPKQQSGVMTRHASGMVTSEATPAPQSSVSQSQTPQPPETYGFKVKTWVISESAVSTKDCDDEEVDTLLPLALCQYMSDRNVESADSQGESGLTEAEMKSAVGGAGVSNSLFSSSAAQDFDEKKKEEKEEKEKEKEKEKAKEEEEAKPASTDGDVSMQ